MVATLQKSKFGYEKLDPEVLKLAMAFSRSGFYPFPYQSSATLILNLMRNYGLAPKVDSKAVAKEVFLSNFSRDCLNAIGAKSPRKNYRPEIVLGRVSKLAI